MYCSTCGASIPADRGTCETCGTAVHRRNGGHPARPAANGHTAGALELRAVGVCPRCDYQGQGLPYFTRGPHMAALVGATLFTLPYALGAGGFIYYGLRRDHRICPRCGKGWGRHAEHALRTVTDRGRPASELRAPSVGEGVKRTWSVLLFILAAVMITVGAVELELGVLALGTLAGAGGAILHRAANRAREERRVAMITALQNPVLKLASKRQGRLTVTDVAASLDWSLHRAEKVLQSLDDGWRVTSEVTDDGVIVYEFRELMLGPGSSTEMEL